MGVKSRAVTPGDSILAADWNNLVDDFRSHNHDGQLGNRLSVNSVLDGALTPNHFTDAGWYVFVPLVSGSPRFSGMYCRSIEFLPGTPSPYTVAQFSYPTGMVRPIWYYLYMFPRYAGVHGTVVYASEFIRFELDRGVVEAATPSPLAVDCEWYFPYPGIGPKPIQLGSIPLTGAPEDIILVRLWRDYEDSRDNYPYSVFVSAMSFLLQVDM